MARRLGLAVVLALAGLFLLAFADLPPGCMETPYRHVPVQARVTERVAAHGDVSLLHLRYVFEGHGYDASIGAYDRMMLPSGDRRFGDLRTGDTLEIWIDPERPNAFPSPRRDQRLGTEPGKIMLGMALLIAGAFAAVAAFVRRCAAGRP